MGDQRTVAAVVGLGELDTSDVTVQLAHGRVGPSGELVDVQIAAMEPDWLRDGVAGYSGHFVSDLAGLYGFSLRVIPAHEDLPNAMDVGLITWA